MKETRKVTEAVRKKAEEIIKTFRRIPPCRMAPAEVEAFFSGLGSLPPKEQLAAVGAKLKEDPGIQNTRAFVQWGIKVAQFIK